MIKNYYQFITESILLSSPEFSEMLYYMKDPVADRLQNLIKKDIKTNYNLLDVANKKDEVYFINDGQLQRKIKSGENPYDLIHNLTNTIGIGRLVSSIFKDNGIPLSQRQLEDFIDRYKATWEERFSEVDIRIVSGEEIRHWYLENNYTTQFKGDLHKSCMRFDHRQHELDIYVLNPEVVKLAIKTRIEKGVEKLISRALIWQTDLGPFLDRVYFSKPEEKFIYSEWARNTEGCKMNYYDQKLEKMTVQLRTDIDDYGDYPFIDSFPYFSPDECKLFNHLPYYYEVSDLIFTQVMTPDNEL